MFEDLLEPDYGVDKSPPDGTNIKQVILYFNESDALRLKQMAKEAMKREWPSTYTTEGNLSDLYLLLLQKYFGDEKTDSEASFF